MSLDINYLRQWVGSVQKSSDVVTPVPLACLNATLDRGDQEPQTGEELPPSGHWLYFLNPARQSEIDINGHAKKGEFLPPVPLERRMWAGGRLKFLAPLRIGDAIKRTSEITSGCRKNAYNGGYLLGRFPSKNSKSGFAWRKYTGEVTTGNVVDNSDPVSVEAAIDVPSSVMLPLGPSSIRSFCRSIIVVLHSPLSCCSLESVVILSSSILQTDVGCISADVLPLSSPE